MDEDNDGRFPDDSLVEVRYPRTRQEELGDRCAWPWLPGSILSQCGPDEWYVCLEARELAVLGGGQLVLLAGHHRRADCGLLPAHRDRHRPPGRRSRLGHLPERDPGRVASSPAPRLHDVAQGNQPRSSTTAATWAVAEKGAAKPARKRRTITWACAVWLAMS